MKLKILEKYASLTIRVFAIGALICFILSPDGFIKNYPYSWYENYVETFIPYLASILTPAWLCLKIAENSPRYRKYFLGLATCLGLIAVTPYQFFRGTLHPLSMVHFAIAGITFTIGLLVGLKIVQSVGTQRNKMLFGGMVFGAWLVAFSTPYINAFHFHMWGQLIGYISFMFLIKNNIKELVR